MTTLGLIGKRVVDFLLVLIELFSPSVTVEALRAITCSKSAISLQRGRPTTIFSQKTKLNDFSYSIKIWTHFPFVLSQSTRLTDGQTDGQTEFSSLDRVCIPCSAVKTKIKYFGSVLRANNLCIVLQVSMVVYWDEESRIEGRPGRRGPTTLVSITEVKKSI